MRPGLGEVTFLAGTWIIALLRGVWAMLCVLPLVESINARVIWWRRWLWDRKWLDVVCDQGSVQALEIWEGISIVLMAGHTLIPERGSSIRRSDREMGNRQFDIILHGLW
ncbi:uncharacterized protein B0T15DRAFT_156881 [Chaetomium strumarium]|uniref:Uncharacterized protein n=1 Tax=Chaetomium strumarium TaxID=1170767 RepID=A0AAJ0GVL1_9PEZI|nr:hypothetical protein B0T15DRAFT_156881 [Chaetomium strumarium]